MIGFRVYKRELANHRHFAKGIVVLWIVLLVDQTGVSEENHWPAASHWQTWSHSSILKVTWKPVLVDFGLCIIINSDFQKSTNVLSGIFLR